MAKSVYFTSITIENLRCFGDRQELKLTADRRRPARWTLILGDNGAGKTTLLQCLAWMRLEPGARDLPGFNPLLFNEVNAFLERLLPVNRTGDLTLGAELSIGSTLSPVDDSATKPTSRPRPVKTVAVIRTNSKRELIDRTFTRDPKRTFADSLVVAYGANRHPGLQNLGKEELEDPIGTRLVALTELYDTEQMLLSLHYASETREHPERDKRNLDHLKRVLAQILPEEVTPDAIRIHAPDRLARGELSGVYLDTFTGLVPWSDLSMGYQTTLAWTADFAWRLLREYPDSENPFVEPAVVLIDEIDLHLHPRWQNGIMEDLSAIFRGTQFVATSHSPLMAQVAEHANFVLLNKRDEEKDVEIVNDPATVKGWRVDQILTSELFGAIGARSPQTELLITRRDQLLVMVSRNQDEESELKRLRVQISNLPSAQFGSDREAMNYIRETAALLRKHRSANQ